MRLKAIVLTAFVLAAVRVASADTLTLDNPPSPYTMGGVYVGPYQFTDSSGATLELICDTFQNEVYIGESWNVTVTSFPAGMSYANSGVTSTQEAEVGWLAEQIFQDYKNPKNAELVGQLQWAIWEILDQAGVLSSSYYNSISKYDQGQITYWMGQAATSGTYSNLYIYDPISGSQKPSADGPPQGYIGVPEPGVLLLMSFGLCSLLAFCRRFAQ